MPRKHPWRLPVGPGLDAGRGDFDLAVQRAQEGVQRAAAAGDTARLSGLSLRLQFYQNRQPYVGDRWLP